MSRHLFAVLGLLLVFPAPALAADAGWTYKGWLQAGSRHFLTDRDRGLIDDNVDLQGEFETTYDFGGPFRARLRPVLAIDPLEPSRNRYEPLDAYGELTFGPWNLRAGQMIESWKIADTYNPVDVLNRRDYERNFYNPDKLGEVIVRLRYSFGDPGVGIRQPALSLYFLPLFREAPLPGNDDRFRFDVNGDNRGDLRRDAIVTSPEFGYAARAQATVLDADVFLFYYGGPNKIPSFAPSVRFPAQIQPIYYHVDTAGGGLQWPIGPWLIKLETAYTATSGRGLPRRLAPSIPDDFFQFVVGVDRTFTDVLGKNEVTVTLEYSGEDEPETPQASLRDLRPYKSNVFVGARWQFHDPRRTEITAAAIVNVLVDEQLFQVNFRTSLYKDLSLVLAGQFASPGPANRSNRTLYSLFPNNSNIQAGLRYEF